MFVRKTGQLENIFTSCAPTVVFFFSVWNEVIVVPCGNLGAQQPQLLLWPSSDWEVKEEGFSQINMKFMIYQSSFQFFWLYKGKAASIKTDRLV